MVRFSIALLSLALANASAASFDSKAKAKADFVATMRTLVKDPKVKSNQARKMKALTEKIASKVEVVRGVAQADDAAAADDAVAAVDDAAVDDAVTSVARSDSIVLAIHQRQSK